MTHWNVRNWRESVIITIIGKLIRFWTFEFQLLFLIFSLVRSSQVLRYTFSLLPPYLGGHNDRITLLVKKRIRDKEQQRHSYNFTYTRLYKSLCRSVGSLVRPSRQIFTKKLSKPNHCSWPPVRD